MFVAGTTLHRDDADTSIANTVNREVLRVTDEGPLLLTSIGAYAQEHLPLSERLKVMGGLRYSHIDYKIGDALRLPGSICVRLSELPGQPRERSRVCTGSQGRRIRQRRDRDAVAVSGTEVRNSIGSLGRVEIADTASYEAGVNTLCSIGSSCTKMSGARTTATRSRYPSWCESESLGKSRRNGGGLDARVIRRTGNPGIRLRVVARGAAAHAGHTGGEPAAGYTGLRSSVGVETGIPIRKGRRSPGPYGRLLDLREEESEHHGNAAQRTIRAHHLPGGVRDARRYRFHLGGFAYPGSRTGESAFLFGSRIGVRPNPRLSVDTGVSYLF